MTTSSFDDIDALPSAAIDELLEITLRDPDEARRMAALEKFISGTEPIEILILSEVACRLADPSIRGRAIERIQERGRESDARILIRNWLNPANAPEGSLIRTLNAEERGWAAESLAEIGV